MTATALAPRGAIFMLGGREAWFLRGSLPYVDAREGEAMACLDMNGPGVNPCKDRTSQGRPCRGARGATRHRL